MTQKSEKTATNKLSSRIISPENFDDLAEIIEGKTWLAVIAAGGIIFLMLAWSIWAEIPIYVTGKGILVYPRKVNNLESPIRGKIEDLKVKDGHCLKKDELIAIIEPSDIKQQIQQEKAKLITLESQDNQVDSLQKLQTSLQNQTLEQQKISKQQHLVSYQNANLLLKTQELETIEKQKASIKQKFDALQEINPELYEKELAAIKQEMISIQQQYQDEQKILPVLRNRWEKRNLLLQEGALSEDQVLQSEQEYRTASQNIARLKAQLQALEFKKTDSQKQYLNNLSTITEYQAQLTELSLKEMQAKQKYEENLSNISRIQGELIDLDRQQQQQSQEIFQDKNRRENQIQETQHNVARLQKQYDDNRNLKIPVTGCILELNISEGTVVEIGQRIGSISLDKESLEMTGIGYFSIGEGKKIEANMNAQITPDNVKRERYGGNVGNVTEVSPFPISKEAASKIIGNPEILEVLEKQGALIEVKIKLQPNPHNLSGYHWSSSSGPKSSITQGTTTTVRVNVEKRRPITFILPVIREWSGIN